MSKEIQLHSTVYNPRDRKKYVTFGSEDVGLETYVSIGVNNNGERAAVSIPVKDFYAIASLLSEVAYNQNK